MEASSQGEARTFEQTISQLSIDVITKGLFKKACRDIFKKVRMPQDGWKEAFELKAGDPTYEYRLRLFQMFIEETKLKYSTINCDNKKAFCKQFSEFVDMEEINCRNEELNLPGNACFEQLLKTGDMKLEGVLVRKSADRVCIVIAKALRDLLNVNELVLSYDAREFPGLNLCLKAGDILRAYPSYHKGEAVFDFEVARHVSMDEVEIKSFLSKLLDLNPASVALTESRRCFAAWDYILQRQECSDCITEKIIEICVKLCSSLQKKMSSNMKKMLEQFAHSKFLSHVLPTFIGDKKEMHCTDKSCMLLQDFLIFVLNANPTCGQKIVNVANSLATKLIDSSEDNTAKETGKQVCKFQCKLSSALAIKIPGVSTDLGSLEWNNLPVIPTAGEIHSYEGRRRSNLPIVKKDEKYDSEDEYLNTYVRLLREESLYKLRKGINDFIKGKHVESRDMRMYRVTLKGICTERHGVVACLSVEMGLKFMDDEASAQFDSESTKWLLYGNLLCISLDDSFKELIWALVENWNGRRTITVKFFTARNSMSDAQIIGKLQELQEDGEEAYMAESSTFYVAFGPAMEVLQNRDFVPFKEYLVDATGSTDPAQYIKKTRSPPDWGTIFEEANSSSSDDKDDEASSQYSLLEDLEKRMSGGRKSKLDGTQLEAVRLALNTKVALIQVVANKNHALDNFLEIGLKKIPSLEQKLVRVPRPKSEDASQSLQNCSFRKVAGTWSSHLFRRMMTVLSRLSAMQLQVKDGFDKLQLQTRSMFSVETVIMEASSDQLNSLLEGVGELPGRRELEELMSDGEANRKELNQHQKDIIEKALNAWLPEAKCFDAFANEQSVSARESSNEEGNVNEHETKKGNNDKKRCIEDENPLDMVDRRAVENERLLDADDEASEEEEITMEEKMKPLPLLLPGVSERKIAQLTRLMDERNVHALSKEHRVGLMYVWQKNYRSRTGRRYQTLLQEFGKVAKEYEEKYQEYEEVRHQRDIEVLKERKVIGMTVDGAAIRAKLLADIKPLVMIVEEAAEILEPQLVAVIPPSVQHLILIGDHKQLRPNVMYNELARRHNLDISMFERLINCKIPFISLGAQCRMLDELAALMRKIQIYEKYETSDELGRLHEPPDYMDGLPVMYFIDHTKHESDVPGTYSKRNVHEANLVSECVRCLRSRGVPSSRITVICSYHGQTVEITQRLKRSESTCDVAVSTIDGFQGKENDIIVVSLVRSNPSFQIGFLKFINRLCVAISRAKFALYIFGNSAVISRSSKQGWKKVVDYMYEKRSIGNRLPFSGTRTEETSIQPGPSRLELTSVDSGQQLDIVALETALALPSSITASIDSAVASEIAQRSIAHLQLDETALRELSNDTRQKVRNLARFLKTKNRIDAFQQLRKIVPSGITGPLQDENLLVSKMPYKERRALTVYLSGREDWKAVAEHMGFGPSEIRYLDVRIRNSFDALLVEMERKSPDFTVGKMYDILVECKMPTVADIM